MTAFIRFVGRFPYSEQPVFFYFIRVTGPSLLFWVMSFGSRHHDVFHFSSLVTCFPKIVIQNGSKNALREKRETEQ